MLWKWKNYLRSYYNSSSTPPPSSSSSSSSVTSQDLIDLFRPYLIVSTKVFQVVFIHLVYNSKLFLTSSCCSVLLHVAASLICIFLVSRQLVLFLTLPKFLNSFCGQIWCTWLFLWKISCRLMSIFLSFFWGGPCISSIWKNGDSQCVICFCSWNCLEQIWFKHVV